MALFMLSLGGIPATAGFLGKWFVFGVLVREGMDRGRGVGALLSVIALGYYLRVIVVLYMQPAPEGAEPAPRAPWSVSAAGALCAVFVLAMGLLPSWFLGLLD
jgi:NADH-quinone oxidoreductase subunit N